MADKGSRETFSYIAYGAGIGLETAMEQRARLHAIILGQVGVFAQDMLGIDAFFNRGDANK